MAVKSRGQIYLLNGIRLVVLVMAVGMGYYYFYQPPAPPESRQYLGDPRTSCAYPIEMVDPQTMRYTMEGGVPDRWDEVDNVAKDGKRLEKSGYRPCQ